MASDRAALMHNYFRRFPRWTVVLIVLGLPLLAFKGAGTVPILLGLIGILIWRRKPTDASIDAWIQQDLQRLETVALERTGLDDTQVKGDTLVLTGPRFWNVGGAEAALRRGKDDEVRFTPVGVTIIFLTADQLIGYQCALDLFTDNALSESTDEYFYQDVVSVSTEVESMTWEKDMLPRRGRRVLKGLMKDGKLQFNAAEVFVLTTAGGTSIRVVLQDPKLIEMAGGGRIPTHKGEKAIAVVRAMLRDKKRPAPN